VVIVISPANSNSTVSDTNTPCSGWGSTKCHATSLPTTGRGSPVQFSENSEPTAPTWAGLSGTVSWAPTAPPPNAPPTKVSSRARATVTVPMDRVRVWVSAIFGPY
jgi:hypothetical protein